ncbi:hypothetical protein IKB17_01535 [bacterium]|nr:hypothetical protein [bacterium]
MDLNSIGGVAMAEQARMTYGIACMKMAQHSENVAQYIIMDSVEISNEAMQKFMAEKNLAI